MPRRKYAQRDEVSATELAEMGFCEKRVQLAHLYGDQATPEQRQAMARGRLVSRRVLGGGPGSDGGSPVLLWPPSCSARMRGRRSCFAHTVTQCSCDGAGGGFWSLRTTGLHRRVVESWRDRPRLWSGCTACSASWLLGVNGR